MKNLTWVQLEYRTYLNLLISDKNQSPNLYTPLYENISIHSKYGFNAVFVRLQVERANPRIP